MTPEERERARRDTSRDEQSYKIREFALRAGHAVSHCQEVILKAEEGSDLEWCVTNVLCSTEAIIENISVGDADGAASLAFNAGMHWAVLNMMVDASRGRKILEKAKEGHQAVFGNEAIKMARWNAMVQDFAAEVAKGTKKTAAAALVAEKHGVSEKTVRRARSYVSHRKS